MSRAPRHLACISPSFRPPRHAAVPQDPPGESPRLGGDTRTSHHAAFKLERAPRLATPAPVLDEWREYWSTLRSRKGSGESQQLGTAGPRPTRERAGSRGRECCNHVRSDSALLGRWAAISALEGRSGTRCPVCRQTSAADGSCIASLATKRPGWSSSATAGGDREHPIAAAAPR